jgi:hypothetical protein
MDGMIWREYDSKGRALVEQILGSKEIYCEYHSLSTNNV